MKKLKDLVEISNQYGKDPDYVIAGGGNTSWKNDDYLWIKASGTSLATITEDGFAKMNRKCLDQLSRKNFSSDPLKRESEIKEELYNCNAGDKSKRPSVETSLHNLINYSFVVHTHPALVNSLMCAKNSRAETQRLFGNDVLYVEYTDPGYILFKLVEKRINEYKGKFNKEPKVIFLENHGVFVAADSTDEINTIYDQLEKTINANIEKDLPDSTSMDHDLDQIIKELSEKTGKTIKAFNSKLVQHFVKDENAFNQVITAFTPDNIVYCKAHYLFSEKNIESITEKYQKFEKEKRYYPKIIGIKNEGILCLEEDEKSVNTIIEVFEDMLKISFLSENFGGPRFMAKEQIEFIDNWEVENYRRKIAKQ